MNWWSVLAIIAGVMLAYAAGYRDGMRYEEKDDTRGR